MGATLSALLLVVTVKEYVHRTVDLVDAKCDLLYVRYECAGSTGTCFTTISRAYVQKHEEFLVHFPFVLSVKGGLSNEFMETVHDGIMSPNGLSRTLATVERRCQSRSATLMLTIYLRPRQLALSMPPTMPTAFWTEFTTIYSSLCENLMKHLKIRRALRIDHSVKFCKRLKIWTGSGKRDGMANCKMLLLAQNEIGQIVGRCLTRSENNDETEKLLKHVEPMLAPFTDDAELLVVSDDVTGVRNLVSRVFGDRVSTKQDPFHVIQRITEKVKSTK
ncbi:hypothetical protein PHYSODRAFT_499664 [Phytophthora sojae]|uniref:MULE transposase domain-containing protein n=1 Tax=Phytophthora sojae (strain P6497) TaxID=1094619 RepID=G4ZEE3_PHYSP|nr:hypothetical protein PHYSODRAFT_499664 [Phytophthora sojae]EGZ18408.1 hypothetical protein PHYSODRAFT_499664 [Phytophthora sojae]|eukprot:XP_009527466.1 hypothetical protein PHYSODRAFT_499664 [Phytophthora sojae]